MNGKEGDGFIGYHIKGMEENLERVLRRQERIERKIDALASGMTPAEISKLVKDINDNAVKVDAASEAMKATAAKLDAGTS